LTRIKATLYLGTGCRVALREGFDAARRQLEDYAREQRGDVKRHAAG